MAALAARLAPPAGHLHRRPAPAARRARAPTVAAKAATARAAAAACGHLLGDRERLPQLLAYLGDTDEHEGHDEGALQRAVEAMQLLPPSSQPLDTYALRLCVLPRQAAALTPLSGFAVGADRYFLRLAAAAASGEESVLTLELTRRGPAGTGGSCSGRDSGSDSDSAGASDDPAAEWRLARVSGEPAHADAPAAPSPEWPPEVVVAAQLAALSRGDASAVRRFATRGGRAALRGPPAALAARLAADARYAPLLRHGAATVRRRQHDEATYLEVVAVEPEGSASPTAVFCFALRLESDCWRIHAVTRVRDATVLGGIRL
jgi:hypothetical protein